MPGFEADSVGVLPRIRQRETEPVRVGLEPAKGSGASKLCVELNVLGGGDIHGPARVMLAETRSRDITQNVFEPVTAGELLTKNLRLARDGAEAGNEQELDVLPCRSAAHARPRFRRGTNQTNRAAVVVDPDFEQIIFLGLGLERKAPVGRVAGRDAEFAMEAAELFGKGRVGHVSSGIGSRLRGRAAFTWFRYAPCSASQRSASIAAAQPMPAAVMAWRYT